MCLVCVLCSSGLCNRPTAPCRPMASCHPMASRHPMASCHLAETPILRPSHLSFTLHIHTYHSHLSFTVTFTAYLGTTSTSPQHPKCVGDFGTGDTHPHPIYIYMYIHIYMYIYQPFPPWHTTSLSMAPPTRTSIPHRRTYILHCLCHPREKAEPPPCLTS